MRQNTSISFTDQSSHVHAGLVRYPEELVFADSAKCAVELRLYDTIPQPGDSNEPVMLTVKEYGTQSGYSETRVRDRNGWAYFDIARYVQMILGEADADGVFDYSEDSELVTQKTVQVKLTAFGVAFQTFTFDAVHGNNGIGDRWWSAERRLRWWTAYPFAFDFPNVDEVRKTIGDAIATVTFPQVSTSLNFTRVRVKASYFANDTFKVDLTKGGFSFGVAGASDTGHVAGTKYFHESPNSVTIVADQCPADPNAAYLRWLDRHCELRHWLFSKYRETDTVQGTDDRRSGFDPDRFVDGVARDGRMRDGILTKELTVNTGYLQGWEYEIVESIVNAPFVDMLDMEAYLADGTILWHRLMVKPGSYTKALRNSHANDHNLQLAVTLQYDGERSVGV